MQSDLYTTQTEGSLVLFAFLTTELQFSPKFSMTKENVGKLTRYKHHRTKHSTVSDLQV